LDLDNSFQTPSVVCDYMVDLLPSHVVTVLEPTPGKGNLVHSLARYDVSAPKDFWAIEGKFDAVVMNPPFSPMLTGYQILEKCFTMSSIIIALMPWLGFINSEKRTRVWVEKGLYKIVHLPRSIFKGSRVQCAIFCFNREYQENIELVFIDGSG